MGKTSLAILAGIHPSIISNLQSAERPTMATPDRIRHYTANNPGIMTLQGTNQYVVGKENVLVIDVALSADSNMDGIIEQAEAMGAKEDRKDSADAYS